MKRIIKDFYPSWFVVCMGTGIMANLFKAYGSLQLSFFFTLINIVLFIIIFLLWSLRWLMWYDDVKKDILNPLMVNYFATMPISLMVVAFDILINKEYFPLSFVEGFTRFALYTGSLLMIVFSITAFLVHLDHTEIPAKLINFAYFMPPVGNIISTILGSEMINRLEVKNDKETIAFISIAMFGVGFMLFLSYLPIIKGRFIINSPIDRVHFPSMFILLAPIGATIVVLNSFSQSLVKAGFTEKGTFIDMLNIAAALLWGFGTWIFVALFVLLLKNARQKIPFSLAYWAFIFPVGIYLLGSFKISNLYKLSWLLLFSKIMVWVLLLIWLFNILLTIRNVINKKLLTRQ